MSLEEMWKRLVITGRPTRNAYRFAINLFNSNGDNVLHFNARFDENVSF